MICYTYNYKWYVLKKKTFLNSVLQTQHSCNAVYVQNNSRHCVVDLWHMNADLQTHVLTHMVYSQTEKHYNITPLGVKSPKFHHKSSGVKAQSFSRHNCFNLRIISYLAITTKCRAVCVYLGQLLSLHGSWHCQRHFYVVLWLWPSPSIAKHDRICQLPFCLFCALSACVRNMVLF